jgi:UDP-2,4-diacetamido-2,4,6-trideoxy-beta-L-altropyranose hydrolase
MSLLFRTEASVVIGTGHVMRCLALAQAWQDAGGRAIFAMAEATPAVEQRLRSEGFEVVRVALPAGSAADGEETARLANKQSASWVVVDGYEFGAEYQARLKGHRLKVLFLDDNGHARHYSADLVLNQNAHASESFYSNREPYTRLLLGLRYVLLRRQFQLWRDWKRLIPPAGRKVLVSMGGSDPGNVTGVLIPALKLLQADSLEVVVVAGGSNPHLETLERTIQPSGGRFRLLKDVDNMAELMAWADVMLAAAGSICWEICAMALPSLLVVTAPNQTHAAQRLAALGAAQILGSGTERIATASGPLLRALLESQEARQSLSSRAHELVDMDGSARVVAVLRGLSEQ